MTVLVISIKKHSNECLRLQVNFIANKDCFEPFNILHVLLQYTLIIRLMNNSMSNTVKSHNRNKVLLAFTFIIPGVAHALFGNLRLSLFMLTCHCVILLSLFWSKLIFIPFYIYAYIAFLLITIVFNYVYFIKHYINKKLSHLHFGAIYVVVLITIISGLWITDKSKLFGCGLYYVPSMSMHPTIKPGQFILADMDSYFYYTPQVNDIVIVELTKRETIIKRVIQKPVNVKHDISDYYLQGDNANNSIDSRHFGPVKFDRIIGKAKLILFSINSQHQLMSDGYLQSLK